MVKRFTCTDIWSEDWILDLGSKYILFWIYIKDKCDHAGIWRPNKKYIEMIVGESIDLNESLKLFNKEKERVIVLDNGRWFLTGFIPFQYGTVLNLNNKLHKSIYSLLEKFKIDLSLISPSVEVKNPLSRPQQEVNQGVKDKDKDKDKVIVSSFKSLKNHVYNNNYIDFEKKVMDLWNDLCIEMPTLSKVMSITNERRAKLKKRYENKDFREFKNILEAIKEQDFLIGTNDRNWKVTLDWLIANDTNYIKVLEKRYKKDKVDIIGNLKRKGIIKNG